LTEVSVSKSRCLDKGEAADGRSDGPMDMAIVMVMAGTSIAVETACEATLEPMEKPNQGQLRRSEVPATTWVLGDWRIRIV
jgi:hypothetical protein